MSGLPRGGFEERKQAGRRRALVAGVGVLLVLIAWSYAVLSYGDEAGAGKDRPENDPAAPEAPGDAGTQREAQTVPDDNASAREASPEGQTSGAGSASGTSAPTGVPAPAPPDDPEGATGEPDSHDPLGTGASPGDLAPIDQERVRFAAARFVSAAYGYSGKDRDAYNQGVGNTVVWPIFYDSAGSKEVERYAGQVEQTGTQSAALLTRFEMRETTPDGVQGYAYFETGAGYGANGGLVGERLAYRQYITLQRSGAVWKVRATENIEETR